MVKISSGMGDKGCTVIAGVTMCKDDSRIYAYGCIDELSSLLGYINSISKNKKLEEKLETVQKHLYLAGIDLQKPKKGRITKKQIIWIENEEEKLEKKLPKLEKFILPGGTKTASLLHIARSVCRRCESNIVSITEKHKINKNLIVYVNRLSDFLFLLARNENFENKIEDKGV